MERYLEKYEDELKKNGYEILTGKRLSDAKTHFGTDTDVGTKTTVIGLFDFRSFLNLGMLLTDSEKAKEVRSVILDIAIDTINQKTGGNTKYINQREEDFLLSSFEEDNYREKFTTALHQCVDMGTAKFAIYTNKIYQSIFKENAKEYRELLKLGKKDSTRDTFYSEVLNVVSAYENGLSEAIRSKFNALGRKLTFTEVDTVFKDFLITSEYVLAPHLHDSRRKMASRDLCFRDALHKELEEYVGAVSAADFEKFLGEKSKELSQRIEETKDVFERLKDR